MTTEIKKLTHLDIGEFLQPISVFEEVFEMKGFKMPAEKHLSDLLGKDDFMVFVALSGQQVLGGLTAYTLMQYYSEFPLLYIYDLAVKTDYQRKGIGKKLMSGIIDFYRSTGGKPEEVMHFSYPLQS